MKRLVVLLTAIFFLFSLVCFAGDESQSKETDKEKKPELKETKKKDEKKSGYKKRKANNPEIAIETDYGIMTLELYRDVAPIHVDSMLSRIREGFYNGLIFHRIIDGFMIQGGDPTGTGAGNAGYYLPAEFSKLPHLEGTLSMARAQDPNSASSQFFICLEKKPYLDGQYTVFGHLMDGYDVLHAIGRVKTGARDKPVKDVVMRKVTILRDVDKSR
jgi:peptidyl-prolyl cis-trans isomerase B (cyclophilin B)